MFPSQQKKYYMESILAGFILSVACFQKQQIEKKSN